MTDSKPFGAADPMALGKQFWDTWTEFAQQQAGKLAGDGKSLPNWHEGLELWSRLTGRKPGDDAAHAVEQLTEHGHRMMQMMQRLAERTAAGEPLSAADVVDSWKGLYAGANPMLDTLREIATEGARGWDQLMQGVEPALAMARGERNALLSTPAFGYAREQQERWQAIARAQADYVERNAAYHALLAKASQDGLALFESKLAERSEPGRQIDSMRALYDLWIDAAEEAYAKVALSDEFRSAYGAMVNAQMRVKKLVQQEIDRQAASLGLPSRAELDGAHRKIHTLQREMRELRELLRAASTPSAPESATAAKRPARKQAAKKAASKRTAKRS